jgi:Ca2+-binding EF-hand superfamily protein
MDRKHTGSITVTDLFGALRSLSFDLTVQEKRVFQSRLGPAVQGTVNIAEFCADVDPAQIFSEPVRAVGDDEAQIPPDAVVDVLAKLSAIKQSGKADLREEFRSRDLRHEGLIPISQVQPILLGLGLKQADVDVLTDFYSPKPRLINYFGILKDQEMFAPPVLPGDEPIRPEARAVLARLAAAVRANGLNVERAFIKYDPARAGKVDAGRIRAVFDAIGFRISPGDEDVLKRAFVTAGDGKFDYDKLLVLLGEGEDLEEPPAGPAPLDAATVTILQNLNARVQSRRRKVRDGFAGSEPGGIGETEFKKVLGNYGIVLRDSEIQKLVSSYKLGDGTVDWEKFCNDVESNKSQFFA